MKPIRLGIAGLGRSGWNMHADALSKIPDLFQVAAVMELDEARAAEAHAKFGSASYRTFADLIKAELDLIVVATPSQLHAEQTIAALEAGKHVIVEKPMARNSAEADAMIAAAKKAGKFLTVNQNYRYKPAFLKLSEVISSGKLGEIVQISVKVHSFGRRWDWQTLVSNNGGILNNHGAHYLDWLLLNFEDEEPELFAHLQNTSLYAGDADSHAKLILRPKDGPLIDLELTHHSAYNQPTWMIMGTQGTLVGNVNKLEWKYYDPSTVAPLILDLKPTADRSYNSEKLRWQEETVSFDVENNADMVLLYKDLFKTIREGQELLIKPETVRRQIRIFERCHEAMNKTA